MVATLEKAQVTNQITIDSTELSRALSLVSKALPARPSKPILTNILVHAFDGMLELVAFNESIAIKVKLSCAGSFQPVCVPGTLFVGTISTQPKDTELTLSQEECFLVVKRPGSKTRIATQNSEDFPAVYVADGQQCLLNADELREAFHATVQTASSDETKAVLTGVHLSGHDVGSTDGHRLTHVVIKDEIPCELNVPRDAVKVILDIIKASANPEITLTVDDKLASFEVGDIELHARLLEGQYPNYKRLIPVAFEHNFEVSRQEFLKALDPVKLFADDIHSTVTISFDAGELTISSQSKEYGNSKEVLSIDNKKDIFQCHFNCRYLLGGIKALSGETFTFLSNSPTSPILLKDDKVTYLIMPIQKVER